MINLLELSKRQIIAVSTGAVAIGIAGLLTVAMVYADQARQLHDTVGHYSSDTQADTVNVEKTAKSIGTGDSTEAQNSEVPAQKPVQPATPAQPGASKATPASPAQTAPGIVKQTVDTANDAVKDVNGGHIPFTNVQVTPGDPASYIGTVGQCPFYEIAGDKGCYPPSDIVCNADWTVCSPKN